MQPADSTPAQELLEQTLLFCNQAIQRGEIAAARAALGRAVQLSPQDASLRGHRGRLALFLNDHAAARVDLDAALKLDARCALAHSGLARYHLERGELAEAESAARQALQIDAREEEALDVLASVGRPGRVGTVSHRFQPTSPAKEVPRETAVARGKLGEFIAEAQRFFEDVEPPELDPSHLANSRVVASREEILERMPKGGICAEVGTQTGDFAKRILEVLRPTKLHLYDITFEMLDRPYFEEAVGTGRVELHEGDSSTLLANQPDGHFDFIYVDADHSYEGVTKDLAQAERKLKPAGWIVCNDYTLYSPLEQIKYGVYRAVNEFCHRHDFEICLLGLHPWAFHDVALRRRQSHEPESAQTFARRDRQAANGSLGFALAPARFDPGSPSDSATLSSQNGHSRVNPALATNPPTNGQRPASSRSATSPEEDAKLRSLATYVGDDWKQQQYYDDAEQYMETQWRETIWPFIKDADFSCVLDLAAGHGRNCEKLKQHARRLYVVDINQENIDFCQRRFAGDPRFTFIRNDGCSLEAIPAGTISLVYCFDAMVHFDSDVVRAYLREFHRVLRPGGLGFCHHSNLTRNPGGDVHHNPGWRNFMSQQLFAHYCAREGLTVLKAKVIDWTGPESDCVTLFKRP